MIKKIFCIWILVVSVAVPAGAAGAGQVVTAGQAGQVGAMGRVDSVALKAQAAIDRFASAGTLRYASVGVMLCDLRDGRLLASHNPDLAVVTASTMKTVTSSAALSLLGSQYRFRTAVMAVGEIDGSHLKGDLVVVGSGDPTLGSKHFAGNPDIAGEIVEALRQRGIRKIDGKVRIDDGEYAYPAYSPLWEAEDLAWSYGPGVHGVNFADNLLQLGFTSVNGQVSDVKIAPPVPGLKVVNKLSGENADRVELALEAANESLVLTGSASNKVKYSFTLTNPLPGAMLADSIGRALEAADIELRGKDNAVKADYAQMRTQIVEHYSPMLTEIVRSLLDRSDNMFTEALLRAIATSRGRRPTAEDGVAVVRELWRNVGLETGPLFQCDGSGLARSNKASARFFADMLSYVSRQRFGGMSLAELMPTAGNRIGATMASSPMRDRVKLKSGSMRYVQCFVGYYPAESPRYGWAILVNNFTGTRADLKNQMGSLLLQMLPAE